MYEPVSGGIHDFAAAKSFDSLIIYPAVRGAKYFDYLIMISVLGLLIPSCAKVWTRCPLVVTEVQVDGVDCVDLDGFIQPTVFTIFLTNFFPF
jgi:hypothetical protein